MVSCTCLTRKKKKQSIDQNAHRSNLTLPERKAYTDAVTCLMNKPSRLNNTQYPGAVNRYADFIATHINYTFVMHLDGIFLPWHRAYVRLYEQALQEECGYEGSQPYWDWAAYTDKPLRNSTIFNGGPYSLGSDGVFTNATVYSSPGVVYPSGTGGGCVFEGPFTNWTAPFRSFDYDLITDNVNGSLPANSFDRNTSCFSRNLNDYSLRVNNNYSCIETLLSQPTIGDFQNTLSTPEGSIAYGAHGGGHVAMGGEGGDLFTSPTDPVFFLHHAQVDHMWSKWQSQDPATRQFALNGTKTLANVPPSDELQLNDLLSWGPLYEDQQVIDLMSIQAGAFCYTYQE